MSLGLKARCSTVHTTLRDVHKTLTKSRATRRMSSTNSKHTTHDSKLHTPSRNTSQNLPLKPQDSNLHAQASQLIIDPQGSNLCDPETQRTLSNTVCKPQGLNLCHLGNIYPQVSTNQAKGFEPLPLLRACHGPPLHTDFKHRIHLNKPHYRTSVASGRLPFTYSI